MEQFEGHNVSFLSAQEKNERTLTQKKSLSLPRKNME